MENKSLYSSLSLSPARPPHVVGVIGTSQLYSIHGAMMAFTPQFLDHEAFYLCLDSKLLVDLFRTDLTYLKTNWKLMGRPTIVFPILRCAMVMLWLIGTVTRATLVFVDLPV